MEGTIAIDIESLDNSLKIDLQKVCIGMFPDFEWLGFRLRGSEYLISLVLKGLKVVQLFNGLLFKC